MREFRLSGAIGGGGPITATISGGSPVGVSGGSGPVDYSGSGPVG